MMPEYFQTCISCDDPIKVSGFHLHVCEQCRRELDSDAEPQEQIVTCCLYEAESHDESRPLGAR